MQPAQRCVDYPVFEGSDRHRPVASRSAAFGTKELLSQEAAMIYSIGSLPDRQDQLKPRRDLENVAVEPQVFDALRLLMEIRDRIVTRAEIIEKIWKRRIVSDSAISSRIKSARSAVGDDGKLQSLIRTI
jgi:DNA-binding response OmpR family regulator